MPKDTQEALAENTNSDGHNEDWHRADIICGGFPCTDISNAGRRAGITGEFSGLWRWLCGAIRLVRPKYAVRENVAALLGRGMARVQGDLAEVGYDAEWDCIPAGGIGAPHYRDRTWILAYPNGQGGQGLVKRGSLGQTRSWGWNGQADLRLISESPRQQGDRWSQPIICRMDDGVSNRMDRLKCLGNSVVPQILEIIGYSILEAEKQNER